MSKQLIVTRDIPFGDPGRGVLAYTVGQTIDEDVVKRNGWEDYVSGSASKAAKEAQEQAAGTTT